ncbi:MAG: hypothetical protein JSV91_11750 [Phycisphaerales bacterium]|nr:MAG: hypothetical protein JSV91_11750 [Phycisphaerales bacterium]
MKVLVLYNPISGAGRSELDARSLAQRLDAAGHAVALAETQPEPGEGWLADELAGCKLLVVVGGDGAVRMAGQPAARTDTPIYQYPGGTENLFAREFGMDRSAETLLRAIDRFRIRRVDVGEAEGRPFLLMASVGYDAGVVDDLARRRGRSISHLSYLGPMLRQFLRWRPPRLEVLIDGERLDTHDQPPGGDQAAAAGMQGWVIVANSRQYAARLNPAPMADMSDGLLDVVYVPLRSRLGLLPRMAYYRLGWQDRDSAVVRRRGRTVELRMDPPQFLQLDGDPPGPAGGFAADRAEVPGRVGCVRISLQPKALPVLIP